MNGLHYLELSYTASSVMAGLVSEAVEDWKPRHVDIDKEVYIELLEDYRAFPHGAGLLHRKAIHGLV